MRWKTKMRWIQREKGEVIIEMNNKRDSSNVEGDGQKGTEWEMINEREDVARKVEK